MFLKFDEPLTSVLIIPLIFVLLESIFTALSNIGNIRKYNKSETGPEVEKYVFKYYDIADGKKLLHTHEYLSLKDLCTQITRSSKLSKKGLIQLENVHELAPGIERFNWGIQLAFIAISIQFNNIMLAFENGVHKKDTVAFGLSLLLFQIFLAVLIVMIHMVSDPDSHSQARRFTYHVLGGNVAGLSALMLAFIYLSGLNIQ